MTRYGEFLKLAVLFAVALLGSYVIFHFAVPAIQGAFA